MHLKVKYLGIFYLLFIYHLITLEFNREKFMKLYLETEQNHCH